MTANSIVLSLYPNSVGLCYVAFEEHLRPIDWGIKTARQRKHATLINHAKELIDLFAPTTVILPVRNVGQFGSARLRRVADEISTLARSRSIGVLWISRSEITSHFANCGVKSKDAIARTIAQLMPEFGQHLPPVRKIWMSEDYRMGLFDAVALAMLSFGDLRLETGQRA